MGEEDEGLKPSANPNTELDTHTVVSIAVKQPQVTPENKKVTDRIIEALDVYHDVAASVGPDNCVQSAKLNTRTHQATTDMLYPNGPQPHIPISPRKPTEHTNRARNNTPATKPLVEWCPVGSPSSHHRSSRPGTKGRRIIARMPSSGMLTDVTVPTAPLTEPSTPDVVGGIRRARTFTEADTGTDAVIQHLSGMDDARTSLSKMLDSQGRTLEKTRTEQMCVAVEDLIDEQRSAAMRVKQRQAAHEKDKVQRDAFRAQMWHRRSKRLDKSVTPCLTEEEEARLKDITRPTTAPTRHIRRADWKAPMKAQGRPDAYSSSVFRPSANLSLLEDAEARCGLLGSDTVDQTMLMGAEDADNSQEAHNRPGTPPRGRMLGMTVDGRVGTPHTARDIRSALKHADGDFTSRDLDFRPTTAAEDVEKIGWVVGQSKALHRQKESQVRAGSAGPDRTHIVTRYELRPFSSGGIGGGNTTRRTGPTRGETWDERETRETRKQAQSPPRRRPRPPRSSRPNRTPRPNVHRPQTRSIATVTRGGGMRPSTVAGARPTTAQRRLSGLEGLTGKEKMDRLAHHSHVGHRVSIRKFLHTTQASEGTLTTLATESASSANLVRQINEAANRAASTSGYRPAKRQPLYDPVWDDSFVQTAGKTWIEIGRWRVPVHD